MLSNDKRPQRPATAAVTTATRRAAGAESRDLPQDMSEWKPSDVQKWLTMNNLNHLQLKYDTPARARVSIRVSAMVVTLQT